MTENGAGQTAAIWPLAKFSFQVNWDDAELVFQEVTGLSTETQVIEYREGNSALFSTVKMPGLKKFGTVTLKKGIYKGDAKLWDKFTLDNINTEKRSTITISLLDEVGVTTMTWLLLNAFPVKITFTDMKADGNEVAIESMKFAYGGIK